MDYNDTKDCICDPYSPTVDCCVDCCTSFFSFFLSLQGLVLIGLIVFYTVVERVSQRKSKLWRLIFATLIISTLAKVLRLVFLANPDTRHKMEILSLFFFVTHQNFGLFSFLSLAFFWARLHHDFVAKRGIFGKIFPILVVLTFILYYAQLPIDFAYHGESTVLDNFKLLGGILGLMAAILYVTYGVLLWKKIFSQRERNSDLFYRTFMSTLVTAIFVIIAAAALFITRVFHEDTVAHYLIRHSIYEVCYLAQIIAMPMGFVVHFFKSHTYKSVMINNTSTYYGNTRASNLTEGGNIVTLETNNTFTTTSTTQ